MALIHELKKRIWGHLLLLSLLSNMYQKVLIHHFSVLCYLRFCCQSGRLLWSGLCLGPLTRSARLQSRCVCYWTAAQLIFPRLISVSVARRFSTECKAATSQEVSLLVFCFKLFFVSKYFWNSYGKLNYFLTVLVWVRRRVCCLLFANFWSSHKTAKLIVTIIENSNKVSLYAKKSIIWKRGNWRL